LEPLLLAVLKESLVFPLIHAAVLLVLCSISKKPNE
jgi:hypothetical protein